MTKINIKLPESIKDCYLLKDLLKKHLDRNLSEEINDNLWYCISEINYMLELYRVRSKESKNVKEKEFVMSLKGLFEDCYNFISEAKEFINNKNKLKKEQNE